MEYAQQTCRRGDYAIINEGTKAERHEVLTEMKCGRT